MLSKALSQIKRQIVGNVDCRRIVLGLVFYLSLFPTNLIHEEGKKNKNIYMWLKKNISLLIYSMVLRLKLSRNRECLLTTIFKQNPKLVQCLFVTSCKAFSSSFSVMYWGTKCNPPKVLIFLSLALLMSSDESYRPQHKPKVKEKSQVPTQV